MSRYKDTAVYKFKLDLLNTRSGNARVAYFIAVKIANIIDLPEGL